MSAKETDSEILLQNLNDDSSSDDKRPVDDKARDTGRRTRLFLDMDAKQWLVIASAWIAWMIDVFDGTIFNYVAPSALPDLLGITDSAEAIAKAVEWQGILTAMLLIGWSVGGFIFGYVADRFGRLRTLQITMAMFSIGTAACAAAPNIWFLIVCRIVVSLGIGGEWAAGANLVAESVPDHRRVEAAAIVYTGAPLSLFAASWLTTLVESLVSDSTVSWRVVMALGLLPGVFAFFVRCCVKEPEKWKQAAKDGDVAKRKPNVRLLFSATHRRSVLTGLGLCVPAIILWWSTNAFLATLSTGLALQEARSLSLPAQEQTALVESYKSISANMFNAGGLVGTALVVPIAKKLGRKPLYAIYYTCALLATSLTFGDFLPLSTRAVVYSFFFFGVTIFGLFASYIFYLPEIFPTHLRATGSGFVYNGGRVLASAGPFLVGSLASRDAANAVNDAMRALFYVGFVSLIALGVLPFAHETKNKTLSD